MSKRHHLPSIEALTANDDERLITELRLSDVREHAAALRELLEEVEGLMRASVGACEGASPDGHARGLVAKELARLGCKIVELAGTLTREKGPASAIEMRPWLPSATH
jgi:hypothetical protein